MKRTALCLPFFVVTCVGSTSIHAQDKTARDQLIAARAQYYTPTASGLKAFHCEATIDWKALLTRFGGTEIPDDNPFLKYLQTVHLSVADQLKGEAAMEWNATGVPPEGKGEAAQQVRAGLQMMVHGFFQSWNQFVNGGIVPFPDQSVEVTSTEAGIHLHGTAASVEFDEDFDKNMLLTQFVVNTPAMKAVAAPTYVATEDGLVVSAAAFQINQPPSAPPMAATFRVEYAKVESFQIPSHIVYDIKNVGVIEIRFNTCLVSVATQKPAADTSNTPPRDKANPIEQYKARGYVNDFAGVIDPQTQSQLEVISRDLDQKTKTQLAFVTVTSLEGLPIKDFATQLANRWGVGYKDTNRGVLVLLSINDRQYRIATGLGLESALTDDEADRLGREMIPMLQTGDFGAALLHLAKRVQVELLQKLK